MLKPKNYSIEIENYISYEWWISPAGGESSSRMYELGAVFSKRPNPLWGISEKVMCYSVWVNFFKKLN